MKGGGGGGGGGKRAQIIFIQTQDFPLNRPVPLTLGHG